MNPPDKKSRSLRLDKEVNERLEAVCKAYGVSANSYVLSAVGKTVMQDYQSINIQNNSDEVFAAMHSLFEGMANTGSEKEVLKV